jgi:AmmeMemoRadiSam system protein B/AmmeMemoRadiSam system protein A
VIPTSSSTRPAAVAGLFYPAAPDALGSAVHTMLASASSAALPGNASPKALVVPHAGYVYSGATAAQAYAALKPIADRVTRVVLIGPAHRVAFRGVAVPGATHFFTPLGPVEVDRVACEALLQSSCVVRSDAAHAAEHALEVQLPFLQVVLERFTVVPLVVGDAAAQEVADALERVWGGDETLIVVSSDLSHYLPYEAARRADDASLRQVFALAPDLDHSQACGATPINALMRVAARRGLVPHLLGACNSGDTAGDRDRVVGYAALAFTAALDSDRHHRGRVLLAHARLAIHAAVASRTNRHDLPDAAFLDHPGATFVTLRRHGELRGCIGSLEAVRPLREDVAANARAAALRDPRFPPLTEAELDGLSVEVSLLSTPQPLTFLDEEDLLRQIEAARDGVVLEHGHRRSTFLPQVWEHLDDAREFLRLLKAKAGLPVDFWSDEIRVALYSVEKWGEA